MNPVKLVKPFSLLISAVLALGLVPCVAFADVESTQQLDEYSQDTSTNSGEDELNLAANESLGKENSWRYDDGVLIVDDQEAESLSARITPWSKTDEGFINNRGDIIEGATLKGIDISEHNGKIDWQKVKNSDVDFVILRCGYGQDLSNQDDDYWVYNVSECERLDIPYGVYLYSYADSVVKASGEADHVLRLLQGHTPTYPIYYDLEETVLEDVGNRALLASMAQTFCAKIESAGYEAGVYANKNWWTNYLTDSCFDQWEKWVAQYNYECSYAGDYRIWQCTSTGTCPGISGNVDVNFEFGGATAAGRVFRDLDASAWYMTQGWIEYVVGNDLMTGLKSNGYFNGKFGPDQNLTRGQLATILYRMAGEPSVSVGEMFFDVDYSRYYGDAIAWARETGVVEGYKENGKETNLFGPEDNITREQLAKMLASYTKQYGEDVSSDCSNAAAIDGWNETSEFAKEFLGWAVDNGIISGVNTPAGAELKPQSEATRAQAAKMITVLVRDVL